MLTVVFAALLAAIDPGPQLAAVPSHYARVDGVRVHYKIAGHGNPAIVFVHGWGGNMNVWREQVAYFAPHARVLVVDLPGFGESDKPADAKYTMKFFARAVRAAMDDARVDRAILVGHSMGTPVIREFDRLYPTRTRGLVTVDGALLNNLPREAIDKVIAPLKTAEYQKSVTAMFDEMTGQASPALRNELESAALATPQHVLVSSMEAMFDPAIWKNDKITVPLLVVNTTSPMWSAKYVESVRALAHDLRYTTVENADHFLMLERPDVLNGTIDAWMKTKGWRK